MITDNGIKKSRLRFLETILEPSVILSVAKTFEKIFRQDLRMTIRPLVILSVAENLKKTRWRCFEVIATRQLLVILMSSLMLACTARKYLSELNDKPFQKHESFSSPERVTAGIESNFAPDLSPNGGFVIYTSDRNGNKDLFEKQTYGGYPRQLTDHPADDFSPTISPSGKLIAFVSRRDDAGGDIHVMKLAMSFNRLLGKKEGEVFRVKLPHSEDFNPSWYPDSNRIIFSSRRPGEPTPALMTVDLNDYKPQAFADLRGDQPAVAPDGNRVVFVRDGALFLYDEPTDQLTQLTRGGVVQDGEPKFTNNGSQIVFVRYIDDTNNDGVLDANDAPSIWRLNIEAIVESNNKLPKENFYLEPLSLSSPGHYSPDQKNTSIFFTMKSRESLDVFRIPTQGIWLTPSDLAEIKASFYKQRDYQKKLFILRRATHDFFQQGKINRAAQLAMWQLELLVNEEKAIEARWLRDKIQKNFSSLSLVQASCDITIFELDLKNFLFPNTPELLDRKSQDKLQHFQAKLEKIIDNLDDKKTDHALVRLKAMFLLAKISASLKDFNRATKNLEHVITATPKASLLGAKANLYLARMSKYLGSYDAALQTLVNVFRLYRDSASIVHDVVDAIDELVVQDRPDRAQILLSKKAEFSSSPELASMLQLKATRVYLENDRLILAINELEDLLENAQMKPSTMMDVVDLYVDAVDMRGNASRLEKLLLTVKEKTARKSRGIQKRMQSALTRFYLRRTEFFRSQNRFKEAIAELDKILAYDPRNLSAHKRAIDINYEQGHINRLVVYYRDLLEQNEGRFENLFFLGYALSYKIDDFDDPDLKEETIDECIDLLERARRKGGQFAQLHYALGKVYERKHAWLEKSYQDPSWSAQLQKRWDLFEAYIGLGDPNWIELAVDSLMSAYFLTQDQSIDKMDLAQELAQAFFQLKNYSKSLHYFMKRLNKVEEIPFASVKQHADTLKMAGKAAFYLEKLDLSEAIYRRLVKLWQTHGIDLRLAESYDLLALSLRDKGDFDRAASVYKKLLALVTQLGLSANIVNTHVNLGYCLYKTNKPLSALDHLDKAYKLLKIHKGSAANSDSVTDDQTIQLELAGQLTAAKGFDHKTKKLLILTLRKEIFESLDRPFLTLVQLFLKKQALKDFSQVSKASETFVKEQESIIENNIAHTLVKIGYYLEASKYFISARDLAGQMRSSTQKYPSRAEWINLEGFLKARLRLLALGKLSQEEIRQTNESLSNALELMQSGYDSGEIRLGTGLSRLLSLKSQFFQFGSETIEDDHPTKILAISESARIPKEVLVSAAIMSDEISDAKYRAKQRFLRAESLADPMHAWKYYAKRKHWRLAAHDLENVISHSQSLDLVSDRRLAAQVFEHLFGENPTSPRPSKRSEQSQKDPLALSQDDRQDPRPSERSEQSRPQNNRFETTSSVTHESFAWYRRYLRLRNREVINRLKLAKLAEAHKSLYEIKTMKAIQEELSPDEMILCVHGYRISDGFSLFFLTPNSISHHYITAKKWQDAYATFKGQEKFKRLFSYKRIYLVKSGNLEARPFLFDFDNALTTKILMTELPSPEFLIALKNNLAITKQSFALISLNQNSNRSGLIRGANKGRIIREVPFGDKGTRRDHFSSHILHFDDPISFNPIEARYSILGSSAKSLSELTQLSRDRTAGFRLLGDLNLSSTNLVIFSEIERQLSDSRLALEFNDGHLASKLLFLTMGATTIVLANEPDGQKWVRFYENLDSSGVLLALSKAGIKGQVVGFAGVNKQELLEFAKKSFARSEQSANRYLDANEPIRALEQFEKALYYAKQLEDRRLIVQLLKPMISIAKSKGQFGYAFELARQLHTASAFESIDHLNHYLELARLAQYAGKLGEAERYLKVAFKIVREQTDLDAELDLLRRYFLLKTKQKQFDQAIKVALRAEDISKKSGQYDHIASFMLDRARLYRNQLGDLVQSEKILAGIQSEKLENELIKNAVALERLQLRIEQGEPPQLNELSTIDLVPVEALDLALKLGEVLKAKKYVDGIQKQNESIDHKQNLIIARYYMKIARWDRAETLLAKGLDDSELDSVGSFKLEYLRTMAQLLELQGRFKGALNYWISFLDAAKTLAMQDKIYQAQIAIADIWVALNKFSQVDKLLSSNEFSNHEPSNQNLKLSAVLTVASVDMVQERFDVALDRLTMAESIAHKIGQNQFRWRINYGLAQVYRRLGQTQKSLDYYQRALSDYGRYRFCQDGLSRGSFKKIAFERFIVEYLTELIEQKQYARAQYLLYVREHYREHRTAALTFRKPLSYSAYREKLSLFLKNSALISYFVADSATYAFIQKPRFLKVVRISVTKKMLKQSIDTYRYLLANLATVTGLESKLSELLVRPVEQYIRGLAHVNLLVDPALDDLSFYALRFQEKYLIDLVSLSHFRGPVISNDAEFAYDIRTISGQSALTEKLANRIEQVSFSHSSPERPKKKGLVLAATIDVKSHPQLAKIKRSDRFWLSEEVSHSSFYFAFKIDAHQKSELRKRLIAYLSSQGDRLVAPVWNYEDVSSALTVKRFYQYLDSEKLGAMALRKAMLITKFHYPHPAYWANYRYIGAGNFSYSNSGS